ncbi:MAG: hypothetical protein IPJ38_14675 [Dechloromonas sp.]|uniref:Uncharacterized protein n=1 Tax=Candidatus Dechloromonas phosphorivorans TaxID=2899244 RepID=A0A935K3X1_9RHOO|nr:hypothetical protein [Candidatus Dechloromonas phosphorivorans]
MRHVALNVQAIFTVLTEWLKESPGLSVLALVPEAERKIFPICSKFVGTWEFLWRAGYFLHLS